MRLLLGLVVPILMYAGSVSAPFTASLSGVGRMPGSAPWNTPQANSFQIEGRVHGITYPTTTNPLVFDLEGGASVLEFHLDSTNLSVYNFWDTTPGGAIAVAHQSMTDFYFRYVRNASALTQTLEIWQYDSASAKYRTSNQTITALATLPLNVSRIGGTMTFSAGFIRIRSGAVPTGQQAPREYQPTADILDYEFENDGTDTGTAGGAANLTYSPGAPTSSVSPVYAPACNSGSPITWRAGTPQTLDGAASFALNNLSTLTYLWQQTAGPSSVVFSSRTARSPTITGILATNTLSSAMYQFQLTVTDSTAVSTSCAVSYGAVATDANGSIVIPDATAAQIIGPQLKFCSVPTGCPGGTPWPYIDDRAAYVADVVGRSIPSMWPQDWNTPATGTIVCTNGSQSCVGTGTNFVTEICTPGKALVLYYPSADYPGTFGRGLHYPSSCADATHLTLGSPYVDSAGTTPAMQYAVLSEALNTAYLNFAGRSNITTANYYDNVLAFYNLFYRTGNSVYRTYARQLADLVWTSPFWDRGRAWAITAAGLSGGPWSMESRKYAMQGIILRANDGQPGMWTGIRHYWDFCDYVYNRGLVPSDHREQGFAMSYLGLCALVDPSGTQRTACLATLSGITTKYLATVQATQSPYGTNESPWSSFPSPSGHGDGSLVKVVDGSTAVTVVSGTPQFLSVNPGNTGDCSNTDTCSSIWFGSFGLTTPTANSQGDSRSYQYTTTDDANLVLKTPYASGSCPAPNGCTKGWAVGPLNGLGQLSYMTGVFLNALDLNRAAAVAAGDTTHTTQWAGWENDIGAYLTDSSKAYWPSQKGFYNGVNFIECTPTGNNVPAGVI
ncbi:MAG: hypothetical protein M3Z32_07480, partial [Acidobacteriota bacterium]|nr:hypothetical protein [Acidobacteriota bacterium]